ncbi:acyl-CoA dehydrogenase family protein [Saccharopolyspora pogona]|uniref:acyl-CoA dehydrogenase family protein n=1 Tax=Saccharopolyspora pogona TaxID=333966 RepID=UPI001687E812|nr:acyl-CoA dehydrogenase family protein [Saccharopolyspora pogona]
MIQWTDEQRALREALEDIGAALGEGHSERDQTAVFPHGQWKMLAGSDLFRAPFDQRWGGLGMDLPATMYLLEGLGYSCRDAGLNFSASTQLVSTGIPLHRFGSESLKARYLPSIVNGSSITAHAISEPDGGSDALNMRCTAVEADDSYILDGNKVFVTNAPVADLFTVYARTGDHPGPGSITAFLIERDTPGLVLGGKIEKMGLRSSPFAEVFLDRCRVPKENVIGRVGSGFWILDHVMKWEILCSFVINVGEMRSRLERTVAYARQRVQAGTPISKHQAISHRIVDMKVALETARMWLYHTAELVREGRDTTVEVAISKLLASEANLASALSAVQVFGGYGYTAEYGLEQELRNSVAGVIYSGTTEIQKNRIAAMLNL